MEIDYKKDNRRDLKKVAEIVLGDYGECIQAKADKMKDTWYQDSDGTWKKLPYKGDAKFLFECMATSPLILDLNGMAWRRMDLVFLTMAAMAG